MLVDRTRQLLLPCNVHVPCRYVWLILRDVLLRFGKQGRDDSMKQFSIQLSGSVLFVPHGVLFVM